MLGQGGTASQWHKSHGLLETLTQAEEKQVIQNIIYSYAYLPFYEWATSYLVEQHAVTQSRDRVDLTNFFSRAFNKYRRLAKTVSYMHFAQKSQLCYLILRKPPNCRMDQIFASFLRSLLQTNVIKSLSRKACTSSIQINRRHCQWQSLLLFQWSLP